jgi:hypothetical protein
VKAEFESMVVTPINPLIAAQRFQDLIKSEDCNLPDKYLQPIFNRVCERTPKTMWRLYCIVMEVMGGFKEMSVDRRRQITQSLIKEVKGMKGRVLRADAPKKVETVEGQQDLPLMMVAS